MELHSAKKQLRNAVLLRYYHSCRQIPACADDTPSKCHRWNPAVFPNPASTVASQQSLKTTTTISLHLLLLLFIGIEFDGLNNLDASRRDFCTSQYRLTSQTLFASSHRRELQDAHRPQCFTAGHACYQRCNNKFPGKQRHQTPRHGIADA